MIYELLVIVGTINGDDGFTSSKTLPTRNECISEGQKISRVFHEEYADGLTFEFRCEERPDDFVRLKQEDSKDAPHEVVPRTAQARAATPIERKAIVAAISKELLDPTSPIFGAVHVYKDKACITVNAKNAFGGYTGNKEYLVYYSRDRMQWYAGSMIELPHMVCADVITK